MVKWLTGTCGVSVTQLPASRHEAQGMNAPTCQTHLQRRLMELPSTVSFFNSSLSGWTTRNNYQKGSTTVLMVVESHGSSWIYSCSVQLQRPHPFKSAQTLSANYQNQQHCSFPRFPMPSHQHPYGLSVSAKIGDGGAVTPVIQTVERAKELARHRQQCGLYNLPVPKTRSRQRPEARARQRHVGILILHSG